MSRSQFFFLQKIETCKARLNKPGRLSFFFVFMSHTKVLIKKKNYELWRREKEKYEFVSRVITSQVMQPPLRRRAPFFPRHGDNSDTRLPCRCRVARPLKETRSGRERWRGEIAKGSRRGRSECGSVFARRRSSEERRG